MPDAEKKIETLIQYTDIAFSVESPDSEVQYTDIPFSVEDSNTAYVVPVDEDDNRIPYSETTSSIAPNTYVQTIPFHETPHFMGVVIFVFLMLAFVGFLIIRNRKDKKK